MWTYDNLPPHLKPWPRLPRKTKKLVDKIEYRVTKRSVKRLAAYFDRFAK